MGWVRLDRTGSSRLEASTGFPTKRSRTCPQKTNRRVSTFWTLTRGPARVRQWYRLSTSLCLVSLWLLPGVTLAAPPKVNGKLEKIGPVRVLRVWGSPEEMGFAHGYLVGSEFLVYLKESIAALPPDQRADYDRARAPLKDVIEVPGPALTEIRAIFKGIKAANRGVPKIGGLNRELHIDDLVLHNAADMIRAFGCSGFTVWGELAGEAGVITTRNFDFPVPGPKTLAQQLVLVRQPIGKRQVALVTWPAMIGAFTGINEDGVCTFMHDGTGKMIRTPQGKYTPLALMLTEVLESGGPADAHAKANKMLQQVVPYPFSYLVRVVAPRVEGVVDQPERVFRVDATGLSENTARAFSCITTNHYLGTDLAPVKSANPWSVRRYQTLDERIKTVVTGKVAWEALWAVARPSDSGAPTLHSLVVYPEKRRLELAFAPWKNKLSRVPNRQPTTITFDRLFATHD